MFEWCADLRPVRRPRVPLLTSGRCAEHTPRRRAPAGAPTSRPRAELRPVRRPRIPAPSSGPRTDLKPLPAYSSSSSRLHCMTASLQAPATKLQRHALFAVQLGSGNLSTVEVGEQKFAALLDAALEDVICLLRTSSPHTGSDGNGDEDLLRFRT
ncbi:hypothetical protein GUJ93_ZPchr0012g19114 [Zizania palustris]|uniref:Uncharacterized protein n=1 Tax=Zizania palustris TaxID=103762 RepID=A0A8J5WNL3_ZIZPA|nr:hypothetical protein GUJ93_ZPchr0012g19114 [Zizania palustris]